MQSQRVRPEPAPSETRLDPGQSLTCCFTDERSEGGELDLDGIDDQEIEKVLGPSGAGSLLTGP